MTGAVISLSLCLTLSFIVMAMQQKKISQLKAESETHCNGELRLLQMLEEYKNAYAREVLKNRNNQKIVREVPKGTIQAVKLAMKLSHPDNGGNEQDFIMYRRAYNIFMGKEKA